MARVLQIRNFARWKDNIFHFLIESKISDFRINLRSCLLQKYEKKQLIGRMKQRMRVLT